MRAAEASVKNTLIDELGEAVIHEADVDLDDLSRRIVARMKSDGIKVGGVYFDRNGGW